MSDRGKRISFNIDIPSEALLGLLRKTLTDVKTHAAIKKNPRAVLAAHGIAIDRSVTDDILKLFCATLSRVRTHMVRKKVKAHAFERAFSIHAAEAGAKGVVPRKSRDHSSEYGKNRARSIRFQPDTEIVPKEFWYKEHTTKWDGRMGTRGPLLHIFTLSKLIADLKIAMGETR